MPLKFKAQANGSLDIEIYDAIGLWGTSVAQIAAKLKEYKGKPVNLRINSPGGSITEGLAIMSAIKRHDGPVTAYIDGVAASMAGVVAMAASKIVMPENSFIMIHDPSTSMSGTSEELRKVADVLDKMGEMLITAYTRGGKVDRKKIEPMMTGESSSNEHWLTAAECLDLGLCDEVVADVEAAALLQHAAYYEQHFAAQVAKIPSVIPTGGSTKQPNSNMKNILVAVGLAATASEDDGVQAVNGLKNRVATLEREAKEKDTTHSESLTKAKNAALQQATEAEKNRKSALKALADKYNKDGDLNALLVSALAGDTTPEAFKDIILEAVNARPDKAAIKPDGSNNGSANNEVIEVTDVESFLKAYEACKNEPAKRQLIRKHRALSRQALRG